MKNIASVCCIFMFLNVASLVAQEEATITVAETFSYINAKLEGTAELSNARGDLIVQFFRDGKVNRTDIVPFRELNPDNVDYFPDEKALVIKCIGGKCINRDIKIPKTHGQFARISFVGDFDAKTQMGLIKAFEHLIMSFHNSKYRNNTPFE